MKYSNQNNNSNYKSFESSSQYDEMENSIVDSLSEISIASNLPITIHNQTYLNNTISEVVSLYLWSTDLSTRKHEPKKYKKSRMNLNLDKVAWESDTPDKMSNYSKQMLFNSDENFDDHKKQSPKSISTKRSSSSLLSSLTKDDGGKANKLMIPSLDLSSLDNQTKQENDNKKKNSKTSSSDLKNQKINYDTANLNNAPSVKNEIEILLKDLKLNKYQSSDVNDYYDHDHSYKLGKQDAEKLALMSINLRDLLGRLLEKRKQAKRNLTVDKMNRDEIQSEKIDTQKELLTFEEKHGRPITKLEKDLMRPLYDHYRKVKRLITKPTNGKTMQNTQEAMDEGDDDELRDNKDQKHLFQTLHSLNLHELLSEKEMSVQEKAKLKDKIKNFENDFVKQTGRSLAKEDREFHKEDFERYKYLKAKLKLIDILIEKAESGNK